MIFISRLVLVLMVLPVVFACAEKRTASDSGNDMYIISDGILVIDAAEAAHNNVQMYDRDGALMGGIVVLRLGQTVVNNGGDSAVIEASSNALSVLDANRDNRLDHSDPVWDSMHLAVDYNDDGIIGEGEYALIGECGVDAIKLDMETGQAWSLHADGETKQVKLPAAS